VSRETPPLVGLIERAKELISITGQPMPVYLQLYKYLRPGFVKEKQHAMKIMVGDAHP
jgi:hypothetical protein